MIRFFSILLLLAAAALFAESGFKSRQDAQTQFDQVYGGGDTVTFGEKKTVSNSISKFMQWVIANPKKRVFIVYGSPAEKEPAEILRDFICRKRGFGVDEIKPVRTGVFVVRAQDFGVPLVWDYRAIFLGSPSTNEFIARFEKKGRISLSSAKAQFRLLSKPNCLALACTNEKMFTELVRVLIRSSRDFEDETYSYFFMN